MLPHLITSIALNGIENIYNTKGTTLAVILNKSYFYLYHITRQNVSIIFKSNYIGNINNCLFSPNGKNLCLYNKKEIFFFDLSSHLIETLKKKFSKEELRNSL